MRAAVSLSTSIAAAFSFACTISSELVRAPAGEAESLLVVLVPEGRPPEVYAFERTNTSTFYTVPVPAGDPIALFVLQLGCSLASLGLEPGLLAIAGEGESGRPLPRAEVVLESRRAGGEQTPWVLLSAPAPLLDGIRLVAPDPCVAFEVSRIDIPIISTATTNLSRPTFAVALEDESVFLGLTDHRFFRVSRAGAMQVAISTSTPNLAAARGQDGDLWLIGPGSATAKGHPDRGFAPGPPLNTETGRWRVWIDAARPPDPFELFVLTERHAIERFDGAEWTVLRGELGTDNGWEAGVQRIDPGVAAIIGPSGSPNRDLEIISAAGAVERALPLSGAMDRPTAIANVPELGLVIGTRTGNLLLWDGDHVDVLGGAEQTSRVRRIAPLDRGVLFGGRTGTLLQFHPRFGLCPPMNLTFYDIGIVTAAGNDFLIATAHEYAEEELLLLWLARRTALPPPSACPKDP